MMWGAVIGIVGCAITVYQKFWSIILGRLIYGFSCGMLAISMPRVMEETIPGEYVGILGGCYCLSFAFATLIAYAMAVFLPPQSEPEELANSPVTQVIFAMPILFYLIQLVI
jgi:MFS family permease